MQGYPALMRIYPGWQYSQNPEILHGRIDREGHVVLIVGYDDVANEVVLMDPWDTSWGGQRGTATRMKYSEFELIACDSSTDYMDSPVPWRIDVNIDAGDIDDGRVEVRASVEYVCPEPFSLGQYKVKPLYCGIQAPSGLTLEPGQDAIQVSFGEFSSGDVRHFRWMFMRTADVCGEVLITAHGWIEGREPYPYTDVIGGAGSKFVELPVLRLAKKLSSVE
jgi:hypothetical protein